MKYSVGYQFFDEHDNPFVESLCEISEHIDEVYFPWLDTNTCRASLTNNRGKINWNGQAFLENDLRLLKAHGIKPNLLLNANCYGEKSISNYFKNYILSLVGHLTELTGKLDAVTTTSLFAAQMIKNYFPEVKVRASVNMRIGDIKAMDYVKDFFDGFYLLREHNGQLEKIEDIKNWLYRHNKSLHILVNSGCMRYCSGQIFHDNVVAHENAVKEINNVDDFRAAVCWDYYARKENWVSLLQNTWIRPEDVFHYEGLFETVKLATRMTKRPMQVINSYISSSHRGNLLDLLEPNHTALLQGHYIDNKSFPDDWFDVVSHCDRRCFECDYCENVFKETLKSIY